MVKLSYCMDILKNCIISNIYQLRYLPDSDYVMGSAFELQNDKFQKTVLSIFIKDDGETLDYEIFPDGNFQDNSNFKYEEITISNSISSPLIFELIHNKIIDIKFGCEKREDLWYLYQISIELIDKKLLFSNEGDFYSLIIYGIDEKIINNEPEISWFERMPSINL